MKKIIFGIMALLIASCDMRPPLKVGYEPPPDTIEELDSTVYGFCGIGTTGNRLQIITSTDDTIYFDMEEASRQGRVFGNFSRGDEIYVLPDADHSKGYLSINKGQLLGTWVMPSPYDGSTPSGITLKDGGEAESFGQQGDIIYKSWRIVNGRIQIVETRDDGTDIDYVQSYAITRMTPDSLYLYNEEESYEYGRYKPGPAVNIGVELDYDYEENYDLF